MLCLLFGLWCAAQAQTLTPTNYTYMEVHVMEGDKTTNERFFLGRLPAEGEAVEMVYVGSRDNGAMRFQLRVKQ